ncbi:MAG: ABC transporter permease [Gammaproteobacteria bacterium]|nr:ABC transporter permease [Gammaproteobacteria bacterium]MBU0848304.1 ABC transporter permease [Gammaproteobacteria bacterium]MBU1266997.1 ABC transporter permease [Gammaproteobacteria bacterium]MBU1529562.1 ABC transporter permease [Gammaproteobacteria bacterium]MBU1781143.1 ABC transporter permease [Gammaproteobacteria bacterium]
MQTLLLLASRSAWSRKGSLLLLLLSVITSTCLLLGIDLARQSAKASFSNAVAGTDLIVGAQTSPVSLLLYSVFRIGQATRNVPYAEFERLEQDPRVKSALPIALGDSYRGFAVVGTKAAYFDSFLYGARQNLQFAQGRAFENYSVGKPATVLFEAVLGAEVAARLKHTVGDKIALSHGMQIQQTEPSHANKPFMVVGVLKPTGTPVDQSVHISLAGMEAIHVDWAAGVPVPGADIPAEYVTKFDLQPKSVTAVLLALNNRAGVFRMQRELESRPGVALSAILPGVALSSLWLTVGLVERVLLFVAALVALVSALGLTSVMLVTLGQRRRELAVLRSTGAGPRAVFGLLCLESALVMWVGVALGVVVLGLASAALAPWVQAQFGLQLVGLNELGAGLMAVTAFAAFGSLLGLVPAWQAYRNQLQDGLNPKMN